MLNTFLLLFVALLLVAANGFFVAAEFALVKLRKTQVETISEIAGFRGRILKKVHDNLDAYLSACQVGITLASLALGWIGEPAFSQIIAPILKLLLIESPQLVHWITIIITFLIISYLHIVVGEMAPKSLAIRKPETIGLWTAPGMWLFNFILYPLIYLLNHSAIKILKIFHIDAGDHGSNYSTEEIKMIMLSSEERGRFSEEEWRAITHLIDFSDFTVSEIMQPIGEVVALSASNSYSENLQILQQTRFSRYPYFSDDGEAVLGMIYLKDLLFLDLSETTNMSNQIFESRLRSIELVKPDTLAISLFRRMRQGGAHFTLIGISGLKPLGFITLKNLLGMMVGSLRDEDRHNNQEWQKLDDGTYIGKGSLPLISLERLLDVNIENDHVDSIGGLLMETLGEIPKEGQRVDFADFAVVVKKMSGAKIVLVRVYPQQNKQDSG